MVVNKDNNGRLPSDLFYCVQVAERIDRVETAIHPHARAGPPAPQAAVPGLLLELTLSAFAPLLQESRLVRVLGTAAVAVGPAAPVVLEPVQTKHAVADAVRPILPFAAPGCLVGPGIGNDALHAGRAPIVKRGRR